MLRGSGLRSPRTPASWCAAPISNKVAKMSWRVTEPLDFEAPNDIVASTVLVAGRSEDHRESVKAFFKKRQPVFRGR